MPTLAVIGDVHANFELLERVLERVAQERVDGLLLVGDLGSHDLSYAKRRTPERDARYLASVEEVLRRARAVAPELAYVPGNHDLPDLDFEGNADGRVIELAGVRVGGIGGAGPGRFGFAYEWEEDQIRARPRLDCELLLCHAPPADTTLDRLHARPAHVGSVAIREIAVQHAGCWSAVTSTRRPASSSSRVACASTPAGWARPSARRRSASCAGAARAGRCATSSSRAAS
jgi:Icc-related predicted phosphoesterase